MFLFVFPFVALRHILVFQNISHLIYHEKHKIIAEKFFEKTIGDLQESFFENIDLSIFLMPSENNACHKKNNACLSLEIC